MPDIDTNSTSDATATATIDIPLDGVSLDDTILAEAGEQNPTPPETPDPKPKAKPKPQPKPAKRKETLFISSGKEAHQFDVCGVRGGRDESGNKIVWRVPEERVERFSRHSHVLSGRIIRKD